MAAGGVMANLGTSAQGMFTDGAGDKAILCIYLAEINKTGGNRQEDFASEFKQINEMQTKLLKSARSKLKAPTSLNPLNLVGSQSSDKIGDLDTENTNFLRFRVQYNPATIRLYSVNGKIQSRKPEEGVDKLNVYTFTGKSKLSFDLIFDDCDNMNAFMLNDVVNTNITGVANKGLNTLSHGGNNYSVRKRMDAIMSLLSTSATQQVIFYWANMAFRGAITDVGNKFIMFNPQGHPIRGEMHIELTQDNAQKQFLYNDKYWTEAFSQTFKRKTAGKLVSEGLEASAGGSSAVNKAFNNNFINLGL